MVHKILFFLDSEFKYLVVCLGEGGPTIRKLSFAEIHENVRRYRAALQHAGIKQDDRVVGNRIHIHY